MRRVLTEKASLPAVSGMKIQFKFFTKGAYSLKASTAEVSEKKNWAIVLLSELSAFTIGFERSIKIIKALRTIPALTLIFKLKD